MEDGWLSIIVNKQVRPAMFPSGGYWVKRPAVGNNKHSPPFNAEGQERLALYLHKKAMLTVDCHGSHPFYNRVPLVYLTILFVTSSPYLATQMGMQLNVLR
jgi:hypothetical protein